MMNLILVAYDIHLDARRNRLFRLLKDFGFAVQLSVFECWLKYEDYQRLIKEIKNLKLESQDAVSIYRICENCGQRIVRLGEKKPYSAPQTIIF